MSIFFPSTISSAAAEDGLHPGQDLLHLKGLGDVVVGTHLEAGDLVDGLALGGEHDDGHLGRLTDGAADAPAVETGEHQVQQHQIRLGGAEELQTLVAVGGGDDPIALFLQIEPQELRNVGIVLHDEHGLCHGFNLQKLPENRKSVFILLYRTCGALGEQFVKPGTAGRNGAGAIR